MANAKGDEEKSGGSCEKDAAGEARESEPAGADEATGEARIKPVGEKIGEGRRNLRQRSDYYQRRTGGSEGEER